MPGRDEDEKSGLLPPWLWFWLVVYGLSLPWQIRICRQMLSDLFFHKELPESLTGTYFAFVLRLSNMPELLPCLALLLGILAIFFPWARAAYLEWRYRLAKSPHEAPAIKESETFCWPVLQAFESDRTCCAPINLRLSPWLSKGGHSPIRWGDQTLALGPVCCGSSADPRNRSLSPR
jgi:hypothetical protein